jgi:hypothetical protein
MFYKDYCEKDPEVFIKNAKEVFEMTLNPLKDDKTFILDVTERI